MVNNQDILNALTTLKNKDRPYLHPDDYKKFLPGTIPNSPAPLDDSLPKAQIQAIMDKSNAATLLADVKSQNEKDYNAMVRAQASLNRARGQLQGARGMQAPTVHGKYGNRGSGSLQSLFNVGPTTHNVGKLKGVGVHANMGNYKWHGFNLQLNRSVAPRFINFLNALAKTGYKVNQLGSYRNTFIDGTRTTSLHAYGLAIDINPGQNPVEYGYKVTNLPKGVGRLAAKYGLVWGGNWNGPKYDTMHFSVPYGGLK